MSKDFLVPINVDSINEATADAGITIEDNLILSEYGVNTYGDTPAYALGVKADGSVIEFAANSGPSYGTDNQIPYMNGTTDFQYSANLTFDDSNLKLGSGGYFNFAGGDIDIRSNGSKFLWYDLSARTMAIGVGAADTAWTDLVIIGHGAMASLTQSFRNIAIGSYIFEDATSNASDNIFIGHASGQYMAGGSSNTVVGSYALQGQDGVSGSPAYNAILGYKAGLNITSAGQNMLIGSFAGSNITSGGNNIVLGSSNVGIDLEDGTGNVVIGTYSFADIVSSSYNIGIGYSTGQYIGDTSLRNIMIGYQAGQGSNGVSAGANNNIFIGYLSGQDIESGDSNVAFGSNSLNSITTGSYNVAIGDTAGANVTDGSSGVFVGNSAGTNATGSGSVAIGNNALDSASTNTAAYRVAIGTSAGGESGAYSIFIGYSNGDSGGDYSIGIGAYTMNYTTGDHNIAFGYRAMYGGAVTPTANNNIAMGYDSLYDITTGSYNIALGRWAGQELTTGSNNVLIGYRAGKGQNTLSTYGNAVFIGSSTGDSMTEASGPTFIGANAGYYVDDGDYNTLIGYRAGYGLVGTHATGASNLFLGAFSGASFTTASENIAIGYGAAGNLATGSHNIVIGYDVDLSATDKTHEFRLGDSTTIVLEGYMSTGAWVGTAYEFRTDEIVEYTDGAGISMTANGGASLTMVSPDATTYGLHLDYDISGQLSSTYTFDAIRVTVESTGRTSTGEVQLINLLYEADSKFRVNSEGSVNFDGNLYANAYGGGTITGTETYLLGVSALGNVIEVDPATLGGSGDVTAGAGASATRVAFWNSATEIIGDDGFIWSGDALKLERASAATVTSYELLRLTHTTSATPAVGLGTHINFYLDNLAYVDENTGRIDVRWTDLTATTEDSEMVFSVMTAGTLSEAMTLDSGGMTIVGELFMSTSNKITLDGTGGNVYIENDSGDLTFEDTTGGPYTLAELASGGGGDVSWGTPTSGNYIAYGNSTDGDIASSSDFELAATQLILRARTALFYDDVATTKRVTLVPGTTFGAVYQYEDSVGYTDFKVGSITANLGIYWDTSLSRVGINDDTPSYTLDVNGSIGLSSDLFIEDANYLYFDKGSESCYIYSDTGTLYFADDDTGTEYSLGDLVSGSGGVSGSGVSGRMAYWSGTSALTSSANMVYSGGVMTVGGTHVTGGIFEIAGTTHSYMAVNAAAASQAGYYWRVADVTKYQFDYYTSGSYLRLYKNIATAGNVLTIADSTGDVTLWHDLYFDGGAGTISTGDDGSDAYALYITTGDGVSSGVSADIYIQPGTPGAANNGENLHLEGGDATSADAGHVYIRGGAVSSASTGDNGGHVYITGGIGYSNEQGLVMIGWDGTSKTTESTYVYCNGASVFALTIDQDSSTGHGLSVNVDATTSSYDIIRGYNGAAEVANLDASGDWTAGDFILSSDPRLKNVLEIPVSGLDIVKKLNPVMFNWKDGRDDYDHIGFLSTEVEKVRPELVKNGIGDYQAVSYTKISAINTAAIKDLLKEVEELKMKLKKYEDGNRS